ncbi:carbohydrate ABC transporter permease [Roseomonas sp. JC162]|uniref:Carbohydrate ABC transporter permease n=1 Tax=Neoroseomonas marina TaxID=1232220 RepID=A0A848ED28_9PROT|nr:carbohydrate ABC transporter permease [Neoroseomonas marina]NMJ41417.1 carbohydrate ABC transporter permease [Neoroseomonas marina]
MTWRRTRRRLGRLLLALLLVVIFLYATLPFIWAIATSLRTGAALFDPSPFAALPTLDNYRSALGGRTFLRSIANSVAVAGSVVLLSLLIGLTAGYALGRTSFRGRRLLLATILAVSMFPQVAVLSGMFELIRVLGLYDNLLALTLSYMIFTLPFTVWVLATFMRNLPIELEEAAMVDGATTMVVLTRIFLPLLAPALVTTGLISFIAAWNEFLFALTFTLTDEKRTVPVAIALMTGSSAFELPWGQIMAASVIVTVPLVALVLVFQRRIAAGLVAGAVKG